MTLPQTKRKDFAATPAVWQRSPSLPQTKRKDFAATQREWFLHESQAAKRIIAEAREKIKTSEATLQQQANFRRIRAEEVRQQAALIKNVRQQRKLAGKKR